MRMYRRVAVNLLAVVFVISGTLPVMAESVEDLEKACENAREKKLAPLRAQKIKECKQDKSKDPAACEDFYSTYGDARRTGGGGLRGRGGNMVPRMFDDLPECVKARKARDQQLSQ